MSRHVRDCTTRERPAEARVSGRRRRAREDSAGTDLPSAAVEALLGEQLDYVLEHSPFYRRLIASRRTRGALRLADFRNLPFTTREQLQEDQARHPPLGSYLSAPRERIIRIHRTSGSTGRPLLIAASSGDVEDALVCGARCFAAAGVRPGHLIVHCLNYCMWSGGVTDHLALERAGAAVVPFGVGNSSKLIATMLDIKPTGIHCTPSYLGKIEQRLAEEFGMMPKALGLKLGLFGGEPGLQDFYFRGRIEETWGFRAMDANYGMAEVLSMFGAECQVRDGLHFMGRGVLYPELKDLQSDRPLPWEPGARGELVLTHLRRQCQPLVRYRTSDVLEVVSAEQCGCGLAGPRWRVVGRVDDMVVIRGTNVYVGSIARVINAERQRLTGEYRVLVSRASPIVDFVIKAEARPHQHDDNLAGELEDRLTRELGVRPVVVLLPPGGLPRVEGKTQRLERVL